MKKRKPKPLPSKPVDNDEAAQGSDPEGGFYWRSGLGGAAYQA